MTYPFLGKINYNSAICTGGKRKPKIGLIVGIVGGLFGLLVGCLLLFLCKGRHRGYKREVFVDVAGMIYFLCMKINESCLQRLNWQICWLYFVQYKFYVFEKRHAVILQYIKSVGLLVQTCLVSFSCQMCEMFAQNSMILTVQTLKISINYTTKLRYQFKSCCSTSEIIHIYYNIFIYAN